MMGVSRNSYEHIPQNIPQNYMTPTYPQHSIYPPTTQNTSIAMFHIPQDATNSLYVDGVTIDAS
jgi:hypothetical protein